MSASVRMTSSVVTSQSPVVSAAPRAASSPATGREVVVDAHEVSPSTSTSWSSRSDRSSTSVRSATLWSSASRRRPAGGDEDEQAPAVVGIGSALDVPVGLEPVEVADERRRLDVHEVGELALAGAARRGSPPGAAPSSRGWRPWPGSRRSRTSATARWPEVQATTEGRLHRRYC